MRIRTAIVFVVLGTCLFINLFMSSASSRTLQEGSVRWGVPVDGLQMSISAVGSNNLDNPKFEVVMRNAGERDVTLNLGYMLGNGKVQLPQNISLNVSDALGRTRKLEFFDRRYPAVAGRLDDYIVPLRAGSSYTLMLSLNQFWSPGTNEFELKLFPGKNHITAQFEGGGAKTSNLDVPGLKLINFWLGNLQSNVLVIDR
jgi:hypothetical protein